MYSTSHIAYNDLKSKDDRAKFRLACLHYRIKEICRDMLQIFASVWSEVILRLLGILISLGLELRDLSR